jgi:hypothetical protein
MRTTLVLDDDLYREAKRAALDAGTTVTAIVEAALREKLRRRHPDATRRKKVPLPTFRGRGLMPGIDLDDSASLLDLMEARHPAARR